MKNLSTKAIAFILFILMIGGLSGAFHLRQIDLLNPWLWVTAALAAIVQVLKVEGSTQVSSYNISWLAYGAAFVYLGTPAMLFVILVAHLVEWVWHKYPWYIQAFNIATFMLSGVAAGLVYQAINPSLKPLHLAGALGLLAGLGAFTLVNHFLVGMVIKLARGQSFAQSGVFGPLTLMIDYTTIALGASAALVWTVNPFAVVLSLLPLYLIYSTLKVPALQRQTELDPKTGLYNARYFADALKRELARADRFDRPLTVVMGDLDMLRNINNTYGHLAGDKVLIGISRILQQEFRDYDVVARFGGEEFAVLLPESAPEAIFGRVEKVRSTLEATLFDVSTSITPIRATISFGIAGRENASQTADDLVHNADISLYRAKLDGRNRTYLYTAHTTGDQPPTKGAPPDDQNEPALRERLDPQIEAYHPNPMREEAAARRQEVSQKGTPEVRQKPAPGWLVNVFVGAVLALGIAFVGVVYRQDVQVDWIGLGVFALIVVVTEGFSIDIYVRDTSVSTSATPLIAGALIFGPAGALVISLVLAGTAMIKHRSPINRFLFNTGNHLISSSAAAGLVLLTGSPIVEHNAWIQIILAATAGLVVYIISTMLVSEVMGLSMGQPVGPIWRERFSWLWPYYLAFGVSAYALILGYHFAGVIGALAVLIPAIALRFSQMLHIDQTKNLVSQLKTQNVELETYSNEISTVYENLLHTLSSVIDLRDSYTHGHSEGVAEYAVTLGRELGLSEERLAIIGKAGILHDIGKIGISDSILFKPGPLTPEEYTLIKQHPGRGGEIVSKNPSLAILAPIIRHHHERMDGRGYPDGLHGERIPLEARILGVADAVEAMASNRPYRKAMSLVDIQRELHKHSGTQFDPQVVAAFDRVMADRAEVFRLYPLKTLT